MSKILSFIISVIFPRTCSVCGKNISFKVDSNICNECLSKIQKLTGILCSKCSSRIPKVDSVCLSCKNKEKIYFDVVKAPYTYSTIIKRLIRKFKYNRKTFLAKDLSIPMVKLILEEHIDDKIDIVVPVPMYWLKKWIRGYNQAELLAEEVAKNINKQIYTNILIRKKYTKAQSKLTKQQRYENLNNIFKINTKQLSFVKDKNILLIDDIVTTGSTVNQCSKILKESGAKSVIVVSLARTV